MKKTFAALTLATAAAFTLAPATANASPGSGPGWDRPIPPASPACLAIRPTLDGFAASIYDNAVLHNIVIPPINLVLRAVCQDR
ncbi:hypothetical protein NBRGN_004_00510 [Nocardia brasiliensis NBRC 14402]|uniref:hypothetical protein n=1 Tax=Nocardia brasiliensis TaxID=37326 RepID=UPI000316CA4F|nr:hypothetical protein [Nocardia brasiliensis]ASF12237.1 hypothetical protein CEQ30_38310 [Nocardia brasiliensis]GAJ79188.1 hypothetical protein NBRGN_004_00510 [Nocardia brasiliensis NBRC 14402]SUB53164.1 Uncharacterised protein [Nocardia brasiliensis]